MLRKPGNCIFPRRKGSLIYTARDGRFNPAFYAREYSGSRVVPIATRPLALLPDLRCLGRESDFDSAARIGAEHGAPRIPIAPEHVLARMAEAVAITHREYRVSRRNLLDEFRARRGRAAMVRHGQRIRSEEAGRAVQKLALGGAL